MYKRKPISCAELLEIVYGGIEERVIGRDYTAEECAKIAGDRMRLFLAPANHTTDGYVSYFAVTENPNEPLRPHIVVELSPDAPTGC